MTITLTSQQNTTTKKVPSSKINVAFRYHDHDEMTKILKMASKKHPNLTRLYSIGKSVNGRDIWVMHLTEYVFN